MIGVIGGTFDPIHFGHLRPALEISDQLSLEEVRFIPNANPPHRWQPVASKEDRLAMVKLAIANEKKFVLDEREYHRAGASYTIDTIESLRSEIGEQKPLCLIIGMDAFQHFTQWRDWQGILSHAHLVISSRPGYINHATEAWMENRIAKKAEELRQKPAGMLFFAEVTQFELSATYIRAQRKHHKSIRYLTTHAVNDYILRNNLYEIE